ncbi:hypothetical protein SCA6_002690 [Theobroma cacao]
MFKTNQEVGPTRCVNKRLGQPKIHNKSGSFSWSLETVPYTPSKRKTPIKILIKRKEKTKWVSIKDG